MKITLTEEEKAFAKTIDVCFALTSAVDIFDKVEYGAWVTVFPSEPAYWDCRKLDKHYSRRSVKNSFIKTAFLHYKNREYEILCEMKDGNHDDWVEEAYKDITEKKEEMKKWLHE